MQTQEQIIKKTLDQQFSEKSGIDVSKKERGINLEPVIGMGVTRSIGSDSYPYTILDILDVKGKTILKIHKRAGGRMRDVALRVNDHQVGGSHYKSLKIQPIEYIMANNLGYCEGNIIKYITRWRAKGGIEDLRKIKQYVDFIIENEMNPSE